MNNFTLLTHFSLAHLHSISIKTDPFLGAGPGAAFTYHGGGHGGDGGGSWKDWNTNILYGIAYGGDHSALVGGSTGKIYLSSLLK